MFYSSLCGDERKNRFTFTFKSPFPILAADREFYINEVVRRNWPKQGDITLVSKSLPEHKELPLDYSNLFKVRANLIYNGIIMRPLIDEKTGDVHTELFMVLSVDIGGWVPPFIANLSTGNGPKQTFE